MKNSYLIKIEFFLKKTNAKFLYTCVFLLLAQFAFADCPLGLAPAITSTNLTYHNQNDGTITVNESALTGVGPYTYSWAPGSFGDVSSISGLSKAVYTVEVTDADNCTETATITITDPCDNVTFAPMVFNSTGPTYPTAANGSISLLNFGTLGGTAPLNYSWSPGSFGNTVQITGLTAGTYSLIVTDAKGCTTQGFETIVDAPCNLIAAISNPLDEVGGFSYKPCQGATNGQLYVQTINNIGSLNYLWSSLANNQTTQVATGLGQGLYFVTVTDATTGCQTSTSVQLNESNFDWDVTITPVNPTTIGGSDGTATAAVTCSVCPTPGTDTYTWASGQTSSFIFGLNQGAYTVTATLRNTLCKKTKTVNLVDPVPTCNLQAAISSPLDEIGGSSYKPCPGTSNGQLLVQTLGEVGTLSYSWNNNQTTALASNLVAGIYSVTVTDAANACTATATIVLSESNFDWSISTSGNNPTTFGGNDGNATVSVTCTTCPITGTDVYSWSTNATSSTINNLTAGTYTVTVTLRNTLCIKTASQQINNPNQLCSLQAAISSPLDEVGGSSYKPCPGTSNGQLLVQTLGEVGTLSYSWNNNQTTALASNLVAGTYSVTVTDAANACTATATIVLSESNFNAVLSTSKINPSTAVAADGSATVNVNCTNCSSATHAYLWNNNQTTPTASGLAVGTYTVTVTIANTLCTKTATVTLSPPSPCGYANIKGTLTSVNPTSGSASDGSVSISSVFGGQSPYSFVWSDVNNSTTASVSNLPKGTYTLTITDAGNCTATTTTVLVDPTNPCNGVSLSPTIVYTSTTIPGGADGTATITRVDGGQPAYTYKWTHYFLGNIQNTGETLAANNVFPGTYTVTITDNNNCSATATATIVDAPGSNWCDIGGGVKIPGGADDTDIFGSFAKCATIYKNELYVGGNFTQAGSTNTFLLAKWDGTNWSQLGGGLGLYVAPLEGFIGTPSVDALCEYNGDLYVGGIFNRANGQVAKYLAKWDGTNWTEVGGGLNSYVHSLHVYNNELYVGGYFDSVNVAVPANKIKAPGVVKWNGTNWSTLGAGLALNTTSARAYVTALSTYNSELYAGGNFENSGGTPITAIAKWNGSNWSAVGNGNQLTVVSALAVYNNKLYSGGQGLNNNYLEVWDGASWTTQIGNYKPEGHINTLYVLNNTLYVGGRFSGLSNITIGNPAKYVSGIAKWDGNTWNALAIGGVHGEFKSSVSYNTGSVNFLSAYQGKILVGGQFTSAGSSAIKNLAVECGGVANTCAGVNIIINETANNPTTVGGNDGSIDASNVSGGQAPYTYTWSNAQTTAVISTLNANAYTLTVADANNCSTVKTITLNNPAVGCAFEAAISAPLDTIGGSSYKPCPSASNGQLTVYVTSGSGPYSFLWSNSQTGTTVNDTLNYINNLISDSYTVTVTDNAGCSKTAELFLPESAFNFSVSVSKTDPTIVGGSDGSATAVVNCPDCFTEMVNHSYLWSPSGQTTETANNLVAGTYTVTVTLAKTLCTKEQYKTLYDPGQCAITVGFTPSETVLCNADSLRLTNTSTGSNLVYSWLANGVEFSTLENPAFKTNTDDPLNIKLIATDGNCIDSSEVDIIVKKSPAVRPSVVQFGTKLVSTEDYFYQWYQVGSGAIAGADKRNYTVTNYSESFYVNVESKNGCSAFSDTITPIVVPMPGGGNATINSTCTALGPYYWGGELNGIPSGSLVASANGKAQALGSDVIRITLASNNDIVYTGGNCITGSNLTALASRPDFNSIITDPQYKTVIITAYDWASFGDCNTKNYLDSSFYTPSNKAAIQQEIADLADYLKQFTDKKFIITNWEGDNDIYCGSSSKFYFNQLPCSNYLSSAVAMQRWLEARKAGVDQVGASNVKFGIEFVTTLLLEEKGYPNILHDILPYVGADYFLYSAYESQFYGPTRIASDIDYIRSKLVSYGYDANKLLIGETGFDINTPDARVKLQEAVDVFKQKNIPTAIVWTLLQAATNPGNYGVFDNLGNLTNYGSVIPTNLCAVTCTVDAKFNTSTPSTTICAGTKINFTNTSTDALNYDWQLNGVSFATSTNTSYDALTAGTYTISLIASAGNCKDTMEVVFNVKKVGFTASSTNAACGAANGSAVVTNPSGGTGAYSYMWMPGSSTGATITAKPAGSYTVNVSDANSCSTSSVVVISNTGAPTISVNATAATCNGQSNGSAGVVVTSGGTAPFTYSWSNSATAQTINNVLGGNYVVTVKDAAGCLAVSTIVVSEPNAIAYLVTPTNAACSAANGFAVVSAPSGGTSPYSYSWNAGTSTGATSSLLAAGSYTVKVTDNKGCAKTTSFTISNNGAPFANATVVQSISCNGGNDAQAKVTATGGVFPYTYSWNNAATGQTASALGAQTYTVTVTDANQCKVIATISIPQPAPIVISFANINPACGGANGGASTTVSGGTLPFVYKWSNLSAASTITAIAAGTYTLTVTDNKSCTATSSVVVGNGTPVTASASATNSTICSGANTQLNSSGGTTYAWLPSNSVSNAAINNPTATPTSNTTYTVTVSNASGCSATSTVLIGVNTIAPAAITQSGGTLTSSAGAGNQWYKDGTLITGATNKTYTPTQNGVYTVVVTIAGCSSTPSNSINVVLSGINTATDGVTQLLAYPNPAKDEVEVKLIGLQDEKAVITMYNPFGQLVYTEEVTSKRGNEYRTKISLVNYASGVYWIQVNTKQTNLVQKLIVN